MQQFGARRDLLANRWSVAGFFVLPSIALFASGFLPQGSPWRAVVWVAALTTMGVACIVNAVRCRRVHCYFTGPFLLLMALVSLLYAAHAIPLGAGGWNVIAGVVVIGALVLYCVPEVVVWRTKR